VPGAVIRLASCDLGRWRVDLLGDDNAADRDVAEFAALMATLG
jgi:hypothetical protein